MFEGEHGTTTVSPGELAIKDSFGQSVLRRPRPA